MDCLNIVQWNAQSIISNRLTFTKFLSDHNIHIAIISETWLKPNNRFNIKGYQVERNDCGNKHNGVAILIHNSITYTKIRTHYDNSLQNICVKIVVNNKEIHIVSFYSPSNSNPCFNKAKFDALIKSIPSPMIFAGDFNAHHVSWGCVDTQPRGRDVLEVIDDNNLVLLNDGQKTTVGSLTWRPNALDLSLVSPSLSACCDWSVYDDPLGSYHLPAIINVTLNNEGNSEGKCGNAMRLPVYPNYKKVDWPKYTKYLSALLSDFQLESYSPTNAYHIFINMVKLALDKSILDNSTHTSNPSHSKRNSKSRKSCLPWWNIKCTEVVANSKKAYLDFKYDPTEENYLRFKRLQAFKKLTLKNERTNSWMSLCQSFNRTTPISLIWKHIRKYNKSYTNSNTNDNTWLLNFLHKYTPDSVSNIIDNNYTENLNNSNIFITEPFSYQELKSAILSRRDTAFGMDGIPYIVFKKMDKCATEIFLAVLNKLWLNNEIPINWKEDCLVPILKPECSKSDPNSYRPIALTSCVAKIFEQLLKQRIEFFVEQNQLLPSNQFGFRRGRSARESIAQLHLDIHNATSQKQHLLSVFFDISGAFNSVNVKVLCSELLSIGFPGKFVYWIQSFLSERNVYVKFNNQLYGPRLSSTGVCQGGILSPLLFILYIHRLNIILGSSVKNLQFADDLVVYASGNNLDTLAVTINDALTNLNQYFNYLNLEVNPKKSKIVLFGKRPVLLPIVSYECIPLSYCPEAKFLGVIFTSNLSWKKYIDKILLRANKSFNILKSLTGTFWGADPKILLTLYKSIVRSHFEYGFFCFAADPKHLKSLELIQNKCMRLITGAFKSTPIGALQIECKLPPISIRMNYLKERFILKLFSLSNNALYINMINSISHSRGKSIYLLQDLTELIELLKKSNVLQCNFPWPCYQGSFYSKFPPIHIFIDHNLFSKDDVNAMLCEWSDHRIIYTDGSKTHDCVSSAVFDSKQNFGFGYKIDKNSSIFTAEAIAILFALQHIAKYISSSSKWVIASDSMSVLKNLQNHKINANTNYIIYKIKEQWADLDQLNIKVVFVWVPSHIGVEGNERADFLAKAIVNSDSVISSSSTSISPISLPFTDAACLLKQRMCEGWGMHWYNVTQIENKGCVYSTLDTQINSLPWFCKYEFVNRKFYSIICRMRFGHCRLNFHLFRLKLEASPGCNYCNSQEIQSLHHIFFECSSFGIQRLVLMDELIKFYGSSDLIPRCLRELLLNTKIYFKLYKFIVHTVNEI